MHQENYRKLVIREVLDETEDMRLFYFEQVSGAKILYEAGQYLTFEFNDGVKKARRSYSLASSPLLHEPLFIGLKRIPNGHFSRMLFDHGKPGDALTTTGTGGVFVLPHDKSSFKQVFFFAAGSGIVPVFSLIKTLLHSAPSIHLVLIYSNRSRKSTAFFYPLHELSKRFPQNFHLEFLFSDNEDLRRARLHADLIAHFLEAFSVDEPERRLYYICGPESYMRFCTLVLQSHHIPPINIKKENFNSTPPLPQIEPPDRSPYQLKVITGGKAYQLSVQYPTTILQAARKQGIELPYSCEVGRCGNCIAQCLSGKVWMSNNEVLTDREMAKGFVLTCTGFPISADVILKV